MSMRYKDLVCVACPSRSSSTGESFDAPDHFTNRLNHLWKISVWIHPDSWNSAQAPGGTSLRSWGFSRTRGNISIGGMYAPDAEKQISAVVKVPRCADVRTPTCRRPFSEMILDWDFGTVQIPVSSTLNIRSGEFIPIHNLAKQLVKFIYSCLVKTHCPGCGSRFWGPKRKGWMPLHKPLVPISSCRLSLVIEQRLLAIALG